MKFLIVVWLLSNIIMVFTETIHWFIPSITTFDMYIVTPDQQGTYPVIIFLTAFAGLVPASYYSNFTTKIANQKLIVIGLSKERNITAEHVEEKFIEFMLFITDPVNGIKNLFQNNELTKNVIPDIENQLSFLCHSAGCHVLTLYLTKRCGTKNTSVKLFTMIDPVDGRSRFDTSGQGYVTNPPQILPFKTPVLIISTGFSNVPQNNKLPACAPNHMSNDRFYRSLSGPTWLLNFTDFGHGDMLDDIIRLSNIVRCSTCKQYSTRTKCNYDQFKEDTANAIANFTNGILKGIDGQIQLKFLQNPQSYIRSYVTIKSNVQQVAIPSYGFCQNLPRFNKIIDILIIKYNYHYAHNRQIQ